MPDPNAILSTTIRFDPPLDRPADDLLRGERGLAIELDSGQRVRLNPSDPRSPGFARVLNKVGEQRLPVYIELDPDTSYIRRLLIPLVTRVQAIRPSGDQVQVELEGSHALYRVSRERPNFAELSALLLEAFEERQPLLVTADDAQEIIDARALPPGYDAPPPLPTPGFSPDNRDLLRGAGDTPVTPAQAQHIFDRLRATSCFPLTTPAPCIPFLYPDNGCYTRAHAMCRLLFAIGRVPQKVWIQGILKAATRNTKNCFVGWGWHVAPTLCVGEPGTDQTEYMVIDPSLFTTPVTQARWKQAMNDPKATLTETDASYYYWSATDPDYTKTTQDLARFRIELQIRAVNDGPPPYDTCP